MAEADPRSSDLGLKEKGHRQPVCVLRPGSQGEVQSTRLHMRRTEKAHRHSNSSRRRDDENPKSQRRQQASWSLKQPGFLAGYVIYGDFPMYLAFSPFPLKKDSAFCNQLPLVSLACCSLVLPFLYTGRPLDAWQSHGHCCLLRQRK